MKVKKRPLEELADLQKRVINSKEQAERYNSTGKKSKKLLAKRRNKRVKEKYTTANDLLYLHEKFNLDNPELKNEILNKCGNQFLSIKKKVLKEIKMKPSYTKIIFTPTGNKR
ncbi:hypothetical protein [Marinifilum sp. D714]|uniref:hypothetical protein n=1 Tax=Marinifilum sp. D714 TaxID=2937523 RepID=UPI0027CF30D0|nr:hypothetical protein [Marinifilum sp. D714]MDQ2180515.1 hypothetical protein [Marinifilum sp. D714]